MNVLELQQGSDLWHAARAKAFCASEAAAAMGVSKYMTRDELLRQKATGLAPLVTPMKQRLFDAGHAVETPARGVAEGIMGTDLYPVVATLDIDGLHLLASLDGVDMLETQIWENKLLNASLVEQCRVGELEPHYWFQMEQQLLVSGAERCLFTTSDGTPGGTHSLWYESKPERRAQLLAGWKQFAKDLAAWKPSATDSPDPKPTAKTMPSLPALNVQITGEVTESNLTEYKAVALEIIRSVNRDLKTDQDFSDSAAARKWCEKVEDGMATLKEQALGKMVSIDQLFKTVDEISAEARAVRLELEKLEKARTLSINSEMVADGITKFRAHIEALNATMPAPYMPKINADFGGAINKLRSVSSKQNAINTELARVKIEADEWARRILVNLRVLDARPEMAFLFNDKATILLKQSEDLGVLVKLRISEHEAAEAKKAEALRASIAAEEQAKAERKAREELAAQHAADAAKAPPLAPTPAAAPAQAEVFDDVVDAEIPHGYAMPPTTNVVAMRTAPPAARTSVPTLRIGVINDRLQHFSVTAEGLRGLGFEPAGRERGAPLYHDDEFPAMCKAIAARALAAAQEHATAQATA